MPSELTRAFLREGGLMAVLLGRQDKLSVLSFSILANGIQQISRTTTSKL